LLARLFLDERLSDKQVLQRVSAESTTNRNSYLQNYLHQSQLTTLSDSPLLGKKRRNGVKLHARISGNRQISEANSYVQKGEKQKNATYYVIEVVKKNLANLFLMQNEIPYSIRAMLCII